MKRKMIIAVVIIVLFGLMSVCVLTAPKGISKSPLPDNASVKICPHSGLPCDGDGNCENDGHEDCDSNAYGRHRN